MSSSGTATGLGAMTPATRPVSSRELHVAPIADACRGGGDLVAVFRPQLERRREPTPPTSLRGGWFAFWPKNRFFPGGPRRQAAATKIVAAGKARSREKARRIEIERSCFAKGGNRAVIPVRQDAYGATIYCFPWLARKEKEHTVQATTGLGGTSGWRGPTAQGASENSVDFCPVFFLIIKRTPPGATYPARWTSPSARRRHALSSPRTPPSTRPTSASCRARSTCPSRHSSASWTLRSA